MRVYHMLRSLRGRQIVMLVCSQGLGTDDLINDLIDNNFTVSPA